MSTFHFLPANLLECRPYNKKARWKSSFFVQSRSTDEGEGQLRKRKNEVSEEKPAKRLSTEDNKSEVADTAANALQNLTLAKKAEEQHVEGHADAAITEHKEPVELAPTSDSIGTEHTPEGGRSDQTAGRVKWNGISSGIFISD